MFQVPARVIENHVFLRNLCDHDRPQHWWEDCAARWKTPAAWRELLRAAQPWERAVFFEGRKAAVFCLLFLGCWEAGLGILQEAPYQEPVEPVVQDTKTGSCRGTGRPTLGTAARSCSGGGQAVPASVSTLSCVLRGQCGRGSRGASGVYIPLVFLSDGAV